MNLSISNIAWNISEDENVSKILNKYNVNYIDIIPVKYFPEKKITKKKILKIKNYWLKKKIKISSLQSLLYNTKNLNIFTFDKYTNNSILVYLEKIMKIANGLGAKIIIFGSPKNRDKGNLSKKQVLLKSTNFFRILGNLSLKYNLKVCLEPNPTIYNCNFMTNTIETVEIIKATNHKSIKLNLDLGALQVNNENLKNILKDYNNLIEYVHISEPYLKPINIKTNDYENIINLIYEFCPNITCSIEMINFKKKSNLNKIENAIKVFQKNKLLKL